MKSIITFSYLSVFTLLLLVGCTKDDFTWNVKKRGCYIGFYSSDYDYFNLVSINDMYNNTGGTGPSNYYLDKPIELQVGQSYELHTVFQTTENIIMAYAYFDWNADGDFSDAEESILISNNPANNDNVITVTVPANAKKKSSNARFVLRTGSSAANNPCKEYETYGEVEDYPLVVK